MTTDYFTLTIQNAYNTINQSAAIDNELKQHLIQIERGKRFKVLAYQQKKTGNKIYVIPPVAFEMIPSLLSSYELIPFSGSLDSLAQDSMDGLYDPISFEI